MIPLLIVESRHWKEWIQTLDPAFNVPTVQSLNWSELSELQSEWSELQTIKASFYTIAKNIEYKITSQLKSIDNVN